VRFVVEMEQKDKDKDILDVSEEKPDDWDESQPEFIEDPYSVKPSGNLLD
jgi:Calreticulin family